MTKRDPKDRFHSKYVIDEATGCWVWTAAKSGLQLNYGKFWLTRKYDKAHRASYILFKGEIPDGLWVLHKCDRPECVNPEHLFLGTRQDNVDDMLRKGRGGQWKNPPRGSRRKDSKLTEGIVVDIRKRCANGESQASVGKLYGIQQSTVFKIVHKLRWAHV